MAKKPANEGSDKIYIAGGELFTDKEKNITVPPEKAKRLNIATVTRLNELEETGYLDIKVEPHEVIKEGNKVVKRIAKNGKVLESKEMEEAEI